MRLPFRVRSTTECLPLEHIRIKNGERPPAFERPLQRIDEISVSSSAAFQSCDGIALRPKFEVAEGQNVVIGQVLFRDRKHPEVAYVAPASGQVSEIAFGPRRTLSSLVIQIDPDRLDQQSAEPLEASNIATVRETLLNRGMWPAFKTRPFGRTPTPQAQPEAIFVNAVHASPMAPDPRVVLAGQIEAFQFGVSVLTRLTNGNVHICQPPGDAFVPVTAGVENTCFSGTIAAGYTGTHIDRLHPVGQGSQIWHIGYQEVAAIGQLFLTGQYSADRVVSVSGPAAIRPRLLRTCLGANIGDICTDGAIAAEDGSLPNMLSGDYHTGIENRFLGRFDQQITLIERTPASPPRRSWLTAFRGQAHALIPTSGIERALAVDILPVPLMRALSVGDGEAAKRLGCLALVEEDVAALSRHCTSGADYPLLLRHVLDALMEETA